MKRTVEKISEMIENLADRTILEKTILTLS